MKLFYSRRRLGVLVTAMASFSSPAAIAGPVLATAEITDGSTGSVDLSFTDDDSPVSIRELSTLPGINTVLGQVIVTGTSDGEFNLGVLGQATHEHEARFQYAETIVNSTSVAQAISMEFLINAGKLVTTVFESVPGVNEFLEAGYQITMRFADAIVFQSNALLRQIGVGSSDTTATFSTGGTSLGGTFSNPQTGAPDRFEYVWDDYIGLLDLGVLDAGESGLFEYDVRTFVSAEFADCGSVGCGSTVSSIGDPLNWRADPADTSSIGSLSSFVMTPATAPIAPTTRTAVPEPGTLGLFLAGLMAIAGLRRRGVV